MSENKDNKLTLINEKTANDYLTHTVLNLGLTLIVFLYTIIHEYKMTHMTDGGREQWKTEKFI